MAMTGVCLVVSSRVRNPPTPSCSPVSLRPNSLMRCMVSVYCSCVQGGGLPARPAGPLAYSLGLSTRLVGGSSMICPCYITAHVMCHFMSCHITSHHVYLPGWWVPAL
jgi:hypothetical protein